MAEACPATRVRASPDKNVLKIIKLVSLEKDFTADCAA
jgi:hypothetical protein